MSAVWRTMTDLWNFDRDKQSETGAHSFRNDSSSSATYGNQVHVWWSNWDLGWWVEPCCSGWCAVQKREAQLTLARARAGARFVVAAAAARRWSRLGSFVVVFVVARIFVVIDITVVVARFGSIWRRGREVSGRARRRLVAASAQFRRAAVRYGSGDGRASVADADSDGVFAVSIGRLPRVTVFKRVDVLLVASIHFVLDELGNVTQFELVLAIPTCYEVLLWFCCKEKKRYKNVSKYRQTRTHPRTHPYFPNLFCGERGFRQGQLVASRYKSVWHFHPAKSVASETALWLAPSTVLDTRSINTAINEGAGRSCSIQPKFTRYICPTQQFGSTIFCYQSRNSCCRKSDIILNFFVRI